MSLREGFPKKVAVLLSKFLSTFRCILGQFGDGDGEGETPAQIFWHIGVKKSGTSCPNWGEGGGVKVIWTKFKRIAPFFGRPSLTM